MKTPRGVGIDFGTTNSAVAVAEHLPEGSHVELAMFHGADTFRSVLFFEGKHRALAGPAAIERYLAEHEDEHQGRLIQSIKSLLASSVFSATQIGGRRYTAEDLVTVIIRALKSEAESQTGNSAGRLLSAGLCDLSARRPKTMRPWHWIASGAPL